MRSTRAGVSAGMSRIRSGTYVPGLRASRTIVPRRTESVHVASTGGAAGAIRPDFERKGLPFFGAELEAIEDVGFARQGEDLGHAHGARFGDERCDERAAEAPALLVVAHGEPRDLGQLRGVDLERRARHDLAAQRFGHDV